MSSIRGAPSTINDPLWYSDNGATHHITHDPMIFSKKTNYSGTDIVKLGNSSSMVIHNIGYASFSNPQLSKSFLLHDLTSINKNLLSVS